MTRDGSGAAIRTAGLTKDFPAVRAVDDLTLEVTRGSVFGFLGPNGAGKTTTVRLLLGLLRPTSGTACVLGYDCAREAAQVRRRVGALFQHSGLADRLTAEENLEVYARIWRLSGPARSRRARELLEHLGLWERREERVAGWSRGMRQRLAIARTLLHRPSLVFLDEPTAGLDPVAAAALREDLLELARREGVTVFLNTHNLAEAERVCDHVGVIRDGRLLALGSPAALRSQRAGAARVRIAGRGFSDNVLDLLRGRREVSGLARENGHLLVDLRAAAPVSPLVACLVRLGAEVEEVVRVDDTLERAVLSLVQGRGRPAGSWLVSPDRWRR